MDWHNERRKISELIPLVNNPRRLTEKQAKDLQRSLEKFNLVEVPAINLDNTIIAGHQRLKIMMLLGRGNEEIDVRIPDRQLTIEEVGEYCVRSNKNTGEWNMDILANDFRIEDLLDWGFLKEELSFDVDEAARSGTDAEPKMDKGAELAQKWGVAVGQIWRLGKHKIGCGDSTDMDFIKLLMAGEVAAMCWTDPPYGVSYVGGTKDALTIENDGSKDIPALLFLAFKAADSILAEGGSIYIAHPPGPLSLVFGKSFVETGWHLHETLVWVKDSMVLGHSDYHYKHEPILYGWKGKNRQWFGGRTQVSVFEVPRPKRSEEHPTMKPVELIEPMIINSTPKDGIVFDPFCGSGSTLIACERTGRCCRACEISVEYTAVIIQRWMDATGGEPERIDS